MTDSGPGSRARDRGVFNGSAMTDQHGAGAPSSSRSPRRGSGRSAGEPLSSVDKELPWDIVTQAVASAIVEHLPEATATEAYYNLAVQHLAHVLWRLGAGDQALNALAAILRGSAVETRSRLRDATATTRNRP